MILDSSVILAILFEEQEARRLVAEIQAAPFVGVSAPTLTEASIVLGSRLGFDKVRLIDDFLDLFRVTVLDFGSGHWSLATRAFREFGKGRHPASLNFGDCLSYAAARWSHQKLLYLGEDFRHTDLA